ncbi:hypothetical protein BB561_001296 [Smittium simulii]|uniref:PIPK domain-containing protein n=1 Tax=Smittium simulii TaxID=133385 RepID=A0A2T9YV98_9FUNG|nr:hypothetical protein BB561_001296 [Smittium simulii]
MNKEEFSISESNSPILTPFGSPLSSEFDDFFFISPSNNNFSSSSFENTHSDFLKLIDDIKSESGAQSESNVKISRSNKYVKEKYLNRPIIGLNKNNLTRKNSKTFDLDDGGKLTDRDEFASGTESILNRPRFKISQSLIKKDLQNRPSFPNSMTQSPTKKSDVLLIENTLDKNNINILDTIIKNSEISTDSPTQITKKDSEETSNTKKNNNDSKEYPKQSENFNQFWKSFLSLLQVNENRGVLDVKLNLKYPLLPTDHVVKNCPVIIRETEPSSIISFILSSSDYQNQLEQFYSKYKFSFIEQANVDLPMPNATAQPENDFEKNSNDIQSKSSQNINKIEHNSETEIPSMNTTNQNEIALLHLPGQHAFDLKGSVRNRLVNEENESNVLQDENLINWIQESPIFVRVCAKKYLHDAIWNDTLFLSKMNVMDYSLLVGIDEENDELVVGILDYIRTFTWDKKLESWVKESVFRSQNGKEPTIISPRQYKNRFREAMENYFWMSTDNYD